MAESLPLAEDTKTASTIALYLSAPEDWQHNDTTTEVYGHRRHRSLGVFSRIDVQGMNEGQRNNITNLLNVVVPALRQNQANVNAAILQAILDLHNAILPHII